MKGPSSHEEGQAQTGGLFQASDCTGKRCELIYKQEVS